jgi:hypothetical protein
MPVKKPIAMKKILKLCLVFLLFYVPLKTKAQCDSLVITDIPCDSVIAAINGLSQYTISGTDTPYSVPFAVAYLEICYPEYNADSTDLAALLHCCHPAGINYNDSTLSYCETAIYFRLLLQYALPHRSCLPSWTYNYLITMLLPQIPVLAADSNISLLCKDVNSCNVNCVSVCDDTIISSCDSINSVNFVYTHILADEGLNIDTNLLVSVYTTLYGYAPPYNTIISQISNCNPDDTAIFTEITYTAANPVYSLDSFGHYYVDFDLLATDTPNNLLFSQGLIYINYDTTIFGSNMVSRGVITATRGIDSFYNLSLSDSTPNLLKLSITHDSTNNLTNLDSIHTNRELCHLKINLTSLSTPAVAAAFDTLAMAGHSMYRQTPTGLEFPYDIIRVDGLVGAPQSVQDSITYQISFDSTTTSYHNSSQIAPDTIIFDIIATSAANDNLYTASPAISYNTDAFGTNVYANGIVSCTTTADDDDYTFIVEDYNSNTFQIHLDANTDNYDDDLFSNSPGVWGVGYQVIATCKLTVQNYCAGVHLSVSSGSRGSYADIDYSDPTNPTETPAQYAVSDGPGLDTTAVPYGVVPVISSISPISITAGTFDTLTIYGQGFGCTPGMIWLTNVQGGWMTAQPPDIVSWGDNQISLIVASCQDFYGDNFVPGTGPVEVIRGLQPSNPSPTLTVGYAVLNDRLIPSGRACRVGLWGANTGAFGGLVRNNEYTFTPDISITNNPPALATITHAMNDWYCETGVRFIMGTPVSTNLTSVDSDFINSIFFGNLSGIESDAKCIVTPSGPCGNSAGDTVEVIIDEDYIFDQTLLNQFIPYPWFLGDTSVIPDTISPNLGYASLLGVARHEFGHGMGLRHVLNAIDLMYPTFPPNICNLIHEEDEQGGVYELVNVASHISHCFVSNPRFQSLLICSSSTTGIANIGSIYNINAYPNPFDETITIAASMGSPSNIKIELFDILGQTIISDNCGMVSDTRFQKTISTQGLSIGVYLVRVSIISVRKINQITLRS